jgi:hypothetical protein
MSLSAGTKLGRYEIRSKIGEGGTGERIAAMTIKLLPALGLTGVGFGPGLATCDGKVLFYLVPDGKRMGVEVKAGAAFERRSVRNLCSMPTTSE